MESVGKPSYSANRIKEEYERDFAMTKRDLNKKSGDPGRHARRIYHQIMGNASGPYNSLSAYWNQLEPPASLENVTDFLVWAEEDGKARSLAEHFHRADLIGVRIPAKSEKSEDSKDVEKRYSIALRKSRV